MDIKIPKAWSRTLGAALLAVCAVPAFAATSEISVDLLLDAADFVVGERIRGVVDIVNSSPDKISVGYRNSQDSFFVEVCRASDSSPLTRTSGHPFVARFVLEPGDGKTQLGQKLEVFLGDHYSLRETNRYLAKPVLVHGRMRYEGAPRAFDVVEGVKVGSAMQLFANRKGLQREFTLVHWNRNHAEHLFLTAQDSGTSRHKWETCDLGAILRIDPPTISILPKGEVIVLHRLNNDNFVRTEFWSLPNELEYRHREAVLDPSTASTARVRELYKEGGVKPKENAWWKFW